MIGGWCYVSGVGVWERVHVCDWWRVFCEWCGCVERVVCDWWMVLCEWCGCVGEGM